MILNYVQAHHLDLEFYDRFFKPAASCARTPSTWIAGTVDPRRAEGWASTHAPATSTFGQSKWARARTSC
jgi:hypothetical protein